MTVNLNFNKSKSGIIAAGLMSGTSLDGIDVALCLFEEHKGNWYHEILAAKTINYNEFWQKRLGEAHLLSGENLIKLDREYGDFLGGIVKSFISRTKITPHFIASHGHTVFHNPDKGYTFQIGHGANIAACTGIPVVNDFRSMDAALGGQGAPLVPLGDKLLFADYDSCLNLGGFANISFDYKGKRIAFDICPVNIVINELAQKRGCDYDKNGQIGAQGIVDYTLLEKLNAIEYYRKTPPKSLSREWLASEFKSVLNNNKSNIEDQMATIYAHIVHQTTAIIDRHGLVNILVTGGGALNRFLIKLFKSGTKAEVILPPKLTIKYKEALVFGCLGLLRLKNEINCLSSVTGAKRNSICGAVHMP